MSLKYYKVISTPAKGRWFGKTLQEVSAELGNAVILEPDFSRVVKPHDEITYKLHIHEPPVSTITKDLIIDETADFIVLNKPSGIPVHPTVNYHKNSVTEQLKDAYGPLFPCYRLDRLTSGLLVLAKNSEFASKFKKLKNNKKEYCARVVTESVPEYLNSTNKTKTIMHPIFSYNAKRGYSHFLEEFKNQKESSTEIENAGISKEQPELTIIKCRLNTGRMHQIRKHLALEGMPIHNDEIYNQNNLFKTLYFNPTQQNFDALLETTELRRKNKITGTCSECGSDLYKDEISKLDLHCSFYQFGEHAYHSDPPFR